jgi:uncharacterized protein involved in exopolysaccharide biosynthesis
MTMEKTLPDFNLNGTNLVQMVWNRRKVFIIIGAIAFVVSLIVSLLITPQFKSTAILIPSLATQTSKDVIVASRAHGLTVFGDDEEVEHLLQILSSETLRREIVKRHNLMEHYGISPSDKHAWFKTNGMYSNNVSFMPSKYRSVRIEVYDIDPEKAAQIANSIVLVADSLMRKTKQEVAQKALAMLEAQYQQALEESHRIEDSITAIMKRGVINIPYQAKELTKAWAMAVMAGNNSNSQKISKALDVLADGGGPFTRYTTEMQYSSLQLKEIKETLHILQIEAAAEIPSQFVIDWGVPADKKARPKKMVIVIISTLSALFFTLFLFVLVDFFKKSINPY